MIKGIKFNKCKNQTAKQSNTLKYSADLKLTHCVRLKRNLILVAYHKRGMWVEHVRVLWWKYASLATW